MDSDKFYVYVLLNQANRLYIGSTADLEERLSRHNSGRSMWTRSRGPWKLVYQEEFSTRSEALKRERRLKSGKANQDLRKYLENKTEQ